MPVEVAKKLVNINEYYKMAEVGILKPTGHFELIHGEIYEMSPTRSKHAAIVNKLTNFLNEVLRNEAIIGIQNPVRLNTDSEPEPDISILNYKDDYYTNAHPIPKDILAIIEVSDSTIKYDREVKAPLYASHGIPVYWIVDNDNNKIEILTNPVNDIYLDSKVYHAGDKLTLLDIELEFEDIIILEKPQN